MNDVAPVPPRPTASDPVHAGAKVKVPPEFVMFKRRLVSDEVARVSAPVCAEPKVCWSDETPLLIDEVATQVGVPPDIARTKPLVPAAIDESVSAAVVYKSVLVPPKVETPVPPEDTASGLPSVRLPFVSIESAALVEVANVDGDDVER